MLAQCDAHFCMFQTLQYLQQNAKERAELAATAAVTSTASFGGPATASKMSMQELEELRKQLGSVTTGSTLQQVQIPPWLIGAMVAVSWEACLCCLLRTNPTLARPRLDHALQSGILDHKSEEWW